MSTITSQPNQLLLALNAEQIGATAPEWLELIPAGTVEGVDGRSWENPYPDLVIKRTTARPLEVPLDLNHSTELKAPKGEESPAMAWFTDYEVRDGAVWGKPAWNAEGTAAVTSRQYRGISPVFKFERGTGVITEIVSVGLVNKPNLHVAALNHDQSPTKETEAMSDVAKEIRTALGLADTATVADAVTAINSQKSELQTALNREQTPSLDKFVPRADYDTALNRAQSAETSLQSIKDEQAKSDIEVAINAALEAGKITPASKAYHTAQCQTEGGLERFKAFVDASPVVADKGAPEGKPDGSATALNAEEKATADALGLSHDDFIKAKGAE